MQRLHTRLFDPQRAPRARADCGFPQGQLDELSVRSEPQVHRLKIIIAAWDGRAFVSINCEHR
jgi:hypothetical protein